jgi:hypothetical protein
VEEMLAEHSACLSWDAARKAMLRAVPKYTEDRKSRLKRLLMPHKDVMAAAQKCVAGRGHH